MFDDFPMPLEKPLLDGPWWGRATAGPTTHEPTGDVQATLCRLMAAWLRVKPLCVGGDR